MNNTMARQGASVDWRTYRRLLCYVRPYLPRLVAGFASGMAFAGTNCALVWAVRGGLREIFDPQTSRMPAFLLVAFMFPIIAIFRGACDYSANYLVKWVGHRVVMDLRNAMFMHLHGLSVSYFTRQRTGELISRVSNDTMLIDKAVSTIVADLAKQPLTLVGMIVWLFAVDTKLAGIGVILLPLCIIPIAVFGRKVRHYSRQAQERIADVISILQETIAGVRIVKAFGMEEYETSRFVRQTKAFFGRTMSVTRASEMLEPVIVFIATLAIALVLVYVRATGMKGHDFFTFATAMFMMYDPIKRLSKVHVHIQQSSAAADRIFELLDTESPVREKAGAVSLSGKVEEIVFDSVSFSYEKEPVLTGVSFRVRAGERIAIVGSSGSGKTTLVNLIPRFYDATAGRLLVNGTDIRDCTLTSLRSRIGLVTQDTFLFNDTVAGNICYGCQEASRALIEEAANRAHAHGFIMEMPEKYETIVGERGVRLSGGQRQRLAIARAILRNPPILILDEATSALDTESERLVQAALDEVMSGRTVFAIAHRLSTIINCDRIFVLDGGKIVEQGTHGSLLAAGGIYKRLYDLQFETQGAAPRSKESAI